jgi:hypothetical protein
MGKKIAVLIGSNYIGTKYRLYGCQNDVIKYKTVLINNFGYKNEDIKMLMDLNGYEFPTKANILKNMDWIYQQTCIPNLIDEITFYYSGHGTNKKDLNGDEPDKFDECIAPLDFNKVGFILDDYIYGNFLSKLKPVKKIICVFDSCNSASCTDLPYSFTCINNKLVKQFYSKRPPIVNNPNIFVLSGCLDPKTSLDSAEPDGTPCGLLSYWLRFVLAKYNYKCTIENIIMDIKKGFGKNDQTPVLSVCSNNFVPSTIVFENIQPIIPVNPPKPNNPPKLNQTRPINPTKPLKSLNFVIKENKKSKKVKRNKSIFYKIDKEINKLIKNIFD